MMMILLRSSWNLQKRRKTYSVWRFWLWISLLATAARVFDHGNCKKVATTDHLSFFCTCECAFGHSGVQLLLVSFTTKLHKAMQKHHFTQFLTVTHTDLGSSWIFSLRCNSLAANFHKSDVSLSNFLRSIKIWWTSQQAYSAIFCFGPKVDIFSAYIHV